jgi:hypothetical protein
MASPRPGACEPPPALPDPGPGPELCYQYDYTARQQRYTADATGDGPDLGDKARGGWAYGPVAATGAPWERGPTFPRPPAKNGVLYVQVASRAPEGKPSTWNVAVAGRVDASIFGEETRYERRVGQKARLEEMGHTLRVLRVEPFRRKGRSLEGLWAPLAAWIRGQEARRVVVELYGWPSLDRETSGRGYFDGSVYGFLGSVLGAGDPRVRLGVPAITGLAAYEYAAAKRYLDDPALPKSLGLPESRRVAQGAADEEILGAHAACGGGDVIVKRRGTWCGGGVERAGGGQRRWKRSAGRWGGRGTPR